MESLNFVITSRNYQKATVYAGVFTEPVLVFGGTPHWLCWGPTSFLDNLFPTFLKVLTGVPSPSTIACFLIHLQGLGHAARPLFSPQIPQFCPSQEFQMCCQSYILNCRPDTSGNKEALLRNPSTGLTYGHICRVGSWLQIEVSGSIHCGQVGLDCVRKATELFKGSKPVNSFCHSIYHGNRQQARTHAFGMFCPP